MNATASRAAAALLAAAAVSTVWGARPRTRSVPAEALLAGRSHGVAVSDRGTLTLAPDLEPVVREWNGTAPTLVWDAARDSKGNLYLGTGPDGDLFRVGRDGRAEPLFSADDDPWVTAVAVEADGTILAATAPSGRIWRVDRDGRAEPWSLIEDRYVWALAPTDDGTVFAGVGERGGVLRLGRSGRVEPLFVTGRSHVTSLVGAGDGRLLAGGGQEGAVYLIDAEGHALVLHDDPLPEVAALRPGPDGAVWAALVAPAGEPPRPAVRLRLPDEPEPAPGDGFSELEEDVRRRTLSGFIEGLPGAVPSQRKTRGRILRIPADGPAEEVWSSEIEAPFALAQRDDAMLFGTGEPGRLYAVAPDGEIFLLAEFEQAQLTALVEDGRDTLVASSNPGAVYRLGGARASGSFESAPFDAGSIARWGRIRWEAAGGSIEMYTRTGNSGRPDETWSGWSPAMTDPDAGTIVNPDGRDLQWRAVLRGRQGAGPRLSSVSFRYEPHNRPPRIRSVRAERETVSAGSVRLDWSASDADGDPLEASIQYRPPGAEAWATATIRPPREPGPDGGAWIEENWSWDVGGVPEGEYELRVVVSDGPWNPPGEGREAAGRPARVVIDRTPPQLVLRRTGPREIEADLSDERTAIERLQLARDGRAVFAPRPVDGICDGRRERFRVALPDGADGEGWTVRGEDAAGNRVERPLPP